MTGIKTFILALCLLLSLPAQAHRLKVFAFAEGDRIDGSTYFVGGAPASGAKVEVQSSDGTVLATLNPNADGKFSFQAVSAIDHVFVSNTGDGHVARWTVSAEELAGREAGAAHATSKSSPPPGDAEPAPEGTKLEAQVEQAIAQQIRPLREQLVAYEDQVRLRDILGGIGYILGLAGLTAWWQQRRRHNQ